MAYLRASKRCGGRPLTFVSEGNIPDIFFSLPLSLCVRMGVRGEGVHVCVCVCVEPEEDIVMQRLGLARGR